MSRVVEILHRQPALSAADAHSSAPPAVAPVIRRRNLLPNVKLSLPAIETAAPLAAPFTAAPIAVAPIVTVPPKSAAVANATPPRLPISDTIRELRDNLLGELPAKGNLLTVFFSPEGVGQAARFLLPLAAAVAQRLGGETLLIDACGEPCGAGEFISSKAGPTWHDALLGHVQWPHTVVASRAPKVSVMRSAADASILKSAAWENWPELLEAVRMRYRCVLVHGPAWQSSPRQLLTLAGSANGAHPIISLGKTSHQATIKAVRYLKQRSSARVSSVVAA